ncbi:unnamed protein product [Aphanomyces euteiches]|uniref:Protein kinase domain-containing protein n=1 Tax=Aphanomyces euteiches TaxID=100861 RepID=A0A6G0W3W4_9STRA|nr:hypothetical protein Ae201684_018878 [Aphanomyces euteiches]KAH9136317.1 hypothetical protein AeRB84_018483 [Aphanomyces euteiches]
MFDWAKDKDKQLYEAASKGKLSRVLAQLARGAYVNWQSPNGQTPLHAAASQGYLDIVKELISHHADVDKSDKDGDTPLHLSAMHGHLAVVQALLDHGASINAPDNNGRTPLFKAAEGNHEKVVRALLDVGADVTMKTTTPDKKQARDVSNKTIKALLDERQDLINTVVQSFGNEMVPNLAKNPNTVTFLADPELFVKLQNIQQEPLTFIQHKDDPQIQTALAELDRMTRPQAVSENPTDGSTEEPSGMNVQSIQSAVDYIKNALDEYKGKDGASDIVRVGTTILSLALKFQTHRESVLTTALMVDRIMRHENENAIPSQDATTQISLLNETQTNFESALETTEGWKLLVDDITREAKVQEITTDIIRLQDHLSEAAAAINVDAKVQVVGKVEDLAVNIGNMLEMMDRLTQHLESVENTRQLQPQKNKLEELAIQLHRGLEFYERQVKLGNFPQNAAFEKQVETCREKIEEKANVLGQEKKIPYGIHNIECWMLASEDVKFDPNNLNTALGRGGFATVFKGMYQGEPVAVKRFDRMIQSDSQDLENLIAKEIKAWKDISKADYILTLVGVCTKIPTPILVSELCETNIRRYVRDRPETLLPLVYQFACGLRTLHQANIIHRDLKCDNVLVTYKKTVAIADFGLSRTAMSLELTKSRQGWEGTMNWMSPEQFLKPRSVTTKSDVWSFGITLWEILSNDVPFKDWSEEDIVEAIKTDEERPEKPQVEPHLEPLWAIITKCWQSNPADRPVADDIVEYLETHYSSEIHGLPGTAPQAA